MGCQKILGGDVGDTHCGTVFKVGGDRAVDTIPTILIIFPDLNKNSYRLGVLSHHYPTARVLSLWCRFLPLQRLRLLVCANV
ncbi:hypothetical protein J2S37_000402 [Corynebacterium felinum]|uniref:Uncharacterized protein n=1 Tax=Corynebacterium felinum TaxID=131318 RepID=A0ABU2B758_9CORY|nr:hypothetical protein [Corynebacterium felinum]